MSIYEKIEVKTFDGTESKDGSTTSDGKKSKGGSLINIKFVSFVVLGLIVIGATIMMFVTGKDIKANLKSRPAKGVDWNCIVQKLTKLGFLGCLA